MGNIIDVGAQAHPNGSGRRLLHLGLGGPVNFKSIHVRLISWQAGVSLLAAVALSAYAVMNTGRTER